MNNLFATIYEMWFGLWDENFQLIFNLMYDTNGYLKIGIIWLLVPIVLNALFYFLWKNPHSKFWHWLVWQIVIGAIVLGVDWTIAENIVFYPPQYWANAQQLLNAYGDPNSGYGDYASWLTMVYGLVSGGLALVMGFISSMIYKFFTKHHTHLPF